MVNARLCETARQAFFSASSRHFDFLDCETKTPKCSKCEHETFRLLSSKARLRWLKTVSSTIQDVDIDGFLLPLFVN